MGRRQYTGSNNGERLHALRGFSTATRGTQRSEGCRAKSSTEKVAAKGYLGLGVAEFFRRFWEAVADEEGCGKYFYLSEVAHQIHGAWGDFKEGLKIEDKSEEIRPTRDIEDFNVFVR
ncbi:hypothetical protein U1Q18_005589, partial [Sarracenia purpurea var. burkii]